MRKNSKKKKKLKSGFRVFLHLFLLALIGGISYFYVLQIPMKNIFITGNTIVSDYDIIMAAGIKEYPKLFSISKKEMVSKIEEIPLLSKVTVKRDLFGKITIQVFEEKILFYYKYNNKYVLTNGSFVEDQDSFYGYATLINFTPDVVFENLIQGFKKVNYNIVRMIDEIEYSPYKASDGTVIDEGRFTLKMNDGNKVIIDTVNIRKLNNYLDIYASLKMDEVKGTLYLDTITEDNIYFKSFATQEAEEQERLKAEEARKKENGE